MESKNHKNDERWRAYCCCGCIATWTWEFSIKIYPLKWSWTFRNSHRIVFFGKKRFWDSEKCTSALCQVNSVNFDGFWSSYESWLVYEFIFMNIKDTIRWVGKVSWYFAISSYCMQLLIFIHILTRFQWHWFHWIVSDLISRFWKLYFWSFYVIWNNMSGVCD